MDDVENDMTGVAAVAELAKLAGEFDPLAEKYIIDMLHAGKVKPHVRSELSSLAALFVWADTPQGHTYWRELNEKMSDKYGYSPLIGKEKK